MKHFVCLVVLIAAALSQVALGTEGPQSIAVINTDPNVPSVDNVDSVGLVVQPKLKDYQESIKVSGAYPESKVTITVGEKNGFQYTINGLTNSVRKIAVSGEYFNDEATHSGYARLFLVVDSGVAYYALRPHGNVLDVYVENFYYDEFYFQIITPRPVTAFDLHEGQINATAVLVTGPSRSAVLHPKLKSIRLGARGARSAPNKFHTFQ